MGEYLVKRYAIDFIRKKVEESPAPALVKVSITSALDVPGVRDELERALFAVLIRGSGGFDELEKMTDGDFPPSLRNIPGATALLRSILGGFKAYYMENV